MSSSLGEEVLRDAVVTLSPRSPEDPQVVVLLRRYGEDIARRYAPPASQDGAGGTPKPWLPPTPAVDYTPPRGQFLVAESGDALIGCGGIRPFAGEQHVAELTRMYVVPEQRRRGLARRLLHALEGAARDLGYRRLRLMTGVPQPEALQLYRTAGYRPIEPFGPYADEPTTRCFERELR